jgi:biopolymer transport protein ExbB
MIPDLVFTKLAAGGPLMVPIAALCLVAWILILHRWLWLRRAGRPVALLRELGPMLDRGELREAARLCRARPGVAARAARRVLDGAAGRPALPQTLVREARLRELAPAGRGLSAIAVLAATAPLLGLLGTVTGMIGTFEAITLWGTGNPRPLAEGISEALITTQAGLIVALPVLMAQNVLSRRVERLRRASEDVLNRIGLAFSRGGAAT